jgi:hypothetical protein
MKEQTEEEKTALKKLYDLQGVIMIRILRGESHRNVRRSLGISLKDYLIIMALTDNK